VCRGVAEVELTAKVPCIDGCQSEAVRFFYNMGNCAVSCAIACFKKQRAERGCVFQNKKLFYNLGIYGKIG